MLQTVLWPKCTDENRVGSLVGIAEFHCANIKYQELEGHI